MSQRILFLGQALEKKDFDPIFDEWYDKRIIGFRKAVNNFLNKHFVIKKEHKRGSPFNYQIDKFLTDEASMLIDWNKIQTTYFGNQPVELMVTWRTSDALDSDVLFSNRLNMDLLSKNRTTTTLEFDKIREKYKKEGNYVAAMQQIQGALNDHYKNMIKSLQQPISNEEAHQFHEFLGKHDSKANALQYARSDGNEKGYLLFFLEGQKQSQGILMDCFLNHIAGHHHQILTLMQVMSPEAVNEIELAQAINNLKTDFRTEFSDKEKLQEWIFAGTNKTPWFKGGDMVVFDENGKIVLNIQAKNNLNNDQTGYATTTLANYLKELVEFDISQKDAVRERFWNYFSMEIEHSAVPAKIDNKIEQTAEKLIEDGLSGIIKK